MVPGHPHHLRHPSRTITSRSVLLVLLSTTVLLQFSQVTAKHLTSAPKPSLLKLTSLGHYPQSSSSMDLLSMRGGEQQPPYPPQQQPPPQQNQQPQDPYFDQQEQQQPIPSTFLDDENNNVPFQETFQDKIDSWREYQQEHAAEYQSNISPRDDKGRMKLLTSVSKGSRAITFFILMWRDVHLYELVDQSFKGTLRFMGVVPLTFLFVANMAGVVASITSPGHGAKKRLKAILNLDKLLELYLILYSLTRLVFAPSNLIPKELYISSILHSLFFILQCQTVTRFVWDEGIPAHHGPPPRAMPDDDQEMIMLNPSQRANPRDPYRY